MKNLVIPTEYEIKKRMLTACILKKRIERLHSKTKKAEVKKRLDQRLNQLVLLYAKNENQLKSFSCHNEKHDHSYLQENEQLTFFRKLTEPEKRVNLVLLSNTFNDLGAELDSSLNAVAIAQINKNRSKIETALKTGDLASIQNLDFVNRRDVAKIVNNISQAALERGKHLASLELGVTRPSTTGSVSKLLKYDSQNIANDYVDNINKVIRSDISNGVAASMSNKKLADISIKNAQQKANKLSKQASGTVISQGINDGRNIVFNDNKDLIIAYQRSEILDKNTCDFCISIDGRIVKPNDPFAKLGQVHSNCFLKGTKILTNKGEKNIEDIKVDDIVATHLNNWKKVYHTMSRKYIGNIVEIELENGRIIRCTEDHPFLINGVWIKAKDITEDMKLTCSAYAN